MFSPSKSACGTRPTYGMENTSSIFNSKLSANDSVRPGTSTAVSNLAYKLSRPQTGC